MKRARANRARRAAAGAALAVLLALVSLALTRCTTVGDNITGVTIERSAPTSCVGQCTDLYASLLKSERKRHATEVETCLAIDDELAKKDCLGAEAVRHDAAVNQVAAGKVECLNACNRPGTGSAG